MNQQYLDNLDHAKESLKIWFSNFEQKNNGNQMFSHENEIDRTKTDFARWYYGEGQTFSSFETFRNIEDHYNKMYDLFLTYNNLYTKPVKKSFFSNKFEKHKQALQVLFKRIEARSNELIEQVNLFQNTLLESAIFTSEKNLSDPVSEERSKYENKPELVQTNNISEEHSVEIESEAIFELDQGAPIEEEVPPTYVDPDTEESVSNKLEDADIEETEVESEQIKEKKAILEITENKGDKKKKENFQIANKIDIEEEIRRILN